VTGATRAALAGRRVAVTRAAEQSAELLALLQARGATPIATPTIAVEPPATLAPLDGALRGLARYDWVVFTSANAVNAVADRLAALRLPLDPSPRLAAVGEVTARMAAGRLRMPDFVSSTARGEALASEIEHVDGRRVLFPRGDLAGDALPEGLRDRGATVDEVVVYRTVAGPGARELAGLVRAGEVDAILFMSASSIRYFVDALDAESAAPHPDQRAAAIVCIGPETALAAQRAGLQVSAVGATRTAAAVVDALEEWFGRRSHGERR
jgi:uroporphyrinogen-III synthase